MTAVVHHHYLALGQVQGVNYRARVAQAALRHGVAGSVTNRGDGSVFIDVQGTAETIEAFVRDVSGPLGMSYAREVRRVAEVPVAEGLRGFVILRDRP